MKKLTERGRFEKWVKKFGANLDRHYAYPNYYTDCNAHLQWLAWQASARVKRSRTKSEGSAK